MEFAKAGLAAADVAFANIGAGCGLVNVSRFCRVPDTLCATQAAAILVSMHAASLITCRVTRYENPLKLHVKAEDPC